MRYLNDPHGTRLPIKARHDDQRRVRSDSACSGPSPCASARPRACRAVCAAAQSVTPRVPGVRVRRGVDAARDERRPRRRRTSRRLFRSAAGVRARRAGRALDPRHAGFHLRRAGAFREPDRRVDEDPAAGRAADEVLRREQALRSGVEARARLPAVHRSRRVHQGHLSRLRHRPDRALVRAFDTQRRTADDRGGRRDGAHRREDAGHASDAAARPRQPEPGRRPRIDGHAGREVSRRGVEDLHAMGTRRQGILPRRRPRPGADRKRRGSSASATSPFTRDCRSASDRTSTRPASKSGASPSASRTSTS